MVALRLSRQQIAAIVGNDPEAIKQFETLFSLNQSYLVSGTVDESIIEAGNASAAAGEALGLSVGLDGRLEALEQLPAYTPHLRRLTYGSFYDTTDQTAAAINTAYAMTFNSTELSSGVTIGSPASRIYVDRSNVYNFQFSAQFINTAGGAHTLWIWFRKNGANIANSATALKVEGNNTTAVPAWNYVVQMNAGDYFEIMWEVNDTALGMQADAATGVHPAVPSVILTVTDNISADGVLP